MHMFKQYRKWRGGYWIRSELYSWHKVSKGQLDSYRICAACYGGINVWEDYSE